MANKKPTFDINAFAAPKFSVPLPVSGKRVFVRTLLMKEYKNFFIAKESGKENQKGALMDAVRQALSAVVEGVDDVMRLPPGDVEYIFIQLYISSTGKTHIPIRYKCECGNEVVTNIDLNTVSVTEQVGTGRIVVNENNLIVMRSPTQEDINRHDMDTDEGKLACIIDCIDELHQGEYVFTASELGADIIESVMDSLSGEAFTEMVDFIDGIPRIYSTVDVKCDKCDKSSVLPVIGLADFFV
ncbi:baseplate hub [Vibrio phage EniLVp02]